MAYFLRQEKKKKGIYLQMYDSHWDKCIWRLPTAAFAEQNGRNAELIGRRPLLL